MLFVPILCSGESKSTRGNSSYPLCEGWFLADQLSWRPTNQSADSCLGLATLTELAAVFQITETAAFFNSRPLASNCHMSPSSY